MIQKVFLIAYILFFEASLKASVSIVQNGDFESGNKSPWYAQLEASTSIVSSNSFSGSFSLFADNNPKYIYQDITSTRAGDFLNFTFNVFSSDTGTNTATPILVMWLYSASGDNQYSFNLQKDVWQEINMNSRISQISPSTVINKIGFLTYGGASKPGEVDTYYDSFNITSSIPEPSALSLLAIGLSGLAMVRRRRS
jgi:hypothetical protein